MKNILLYKSLAIRIFKLMISLGVFLFDFTSQKILSVLNKKIPGRCVVLNYHAITPEQSKSFIRQIDELMRSVTPIPAVTSTCLEKGNSCVAVTFDDAFISIYEIAAPELIQRKIPFTIFIPSGYIGKNAEWIKNDGGLDKKHRVMDINMLRGLKDYDQVSFGSHGVSHRNLLFLSDMDAKHEILNSKNQLNNMLNEEITTISFPYGGFTESHVEMAREAGYKRVFSILPSTTSFDSSEFVTGRIRVDPSDWIIEFRLKLIGAYRWLPIAFSIKRKIKRLLIIIVK
jgi:peptidoglycan/xylan/chitin deacetylase (PgdA/CDA1 family)